MSVADNNIAMISLSSYLISLDHLDIREAIQDNFKSLITSQLVSDAGFFSLVLSISLLVFSFLGYFGAVRESRICLILVRSFHFHFQSRSSHKNH